MKFSRSDVFFSVVVVALSSVLLFFYVADANASISGGRSKPLGSISFKKRTAMRKPANTIRWERLKNNSVVYDGDTIRTAEDSEASLAFGDGTSLSVYENSMLKVVSTGSEQELQYLGGTMTVDGSAGDSGSAGSEGKRGGLVVRVGDSKVAISADSLVSFTQEGGNLSVDVSSGSATVIGASGSVAAVSSNEVVSIGAKGESGAVEKMPFVPVAPPQNARFLDRSSGPTVMRFSAKAASPSASFDASPCTLELSLKADFSTIAVSVAADGPKPDGADAGLLSASLPVDQGAWFWRFRLPDGSVTPPRRFSLVRESPVSPALPDDGTSFAYRTKLPLVRFSWSQSAAATAFVFELSSSPDFSGDIRRIRTTMQSLSVEPAGSGTWYWRVVPAYPQTILDSVVTPAARSFSVTQISGMVPPVPVMPVDGYSYRVSDVSGEGFAFSWEPDTEAVAYELFVYSSSPDIPSSSAKLAGRFESSRPFIKLKASEVPFLSVQGKYWWSVRWRDADGKFSPLSAPRCVNGVADAAAVAGGEGAAVGKTAGFGGTVAVGVGGAAGTQSVAGTASAVPDATAAPRLAWPPEGYSVADSLSAEIRYAWKGGSAVRTILQIARDAAFANPVFEAAVTGDSFSGKRLGTGTYYWRLRAEKSGGSGFVDTDARSFSVIGALPPVTLESPAPGSTVIVKNPDAFPVTWRAVPGADCYALELYRVDGSSRVLVDSEQKASGTALDLSLGASPDGRYEVVIQALTLDSPSTTRNTGLKKSESFSVRQLKPVVHRAPQDHAVISGLDAWKNGVTFRWDSPDTPTSVAIEIFRDGKKYPSSFSYVAGRSSCTLPSVPEGTYVWRIRASQRGIDISDKSWSSFTVRKAPPLPAPVLISPEDRAVLGPETFKSARSIRFAWKPVPGATRYRLRLYQGVSTVPVFSKDTIVSSEYDFEGLSLLDRGSFVWAVSAERLWPDGKKAQDGEKALGRFTVTLPAIESLPLKKEDGFYGY